MIRKKATIVDYGMGNIHSVSAAIRHLGGDVKVSSNAIEIGEAETIILPGVGSFPSAMRSIQSLSIGDALQEASQRSSTRILGICLGMQLLGTSSTEDGGSEGLGFLDFNVTEFGSSALGALPVPHIGFNSVEFKDGSALFGDIEPESDFYFVHSYRIAPTQGTALEAHSLYGEKFVSAVETERVFGTQFHPEKSQTNGLKLLANFLEVSR